MILWPSKGSHDHQGCRGKMYLSLGKGSGWAPRRRHHGVESILSFFLIFLRPRDSIWHHSASFGSICQHFQHLPPFGMASLAVPLSKDIAFWSRAARGSRRAARGRRDSNKQTAGLLLQQVIKSGQSGISIQGDC